MGNQKLLKLLILITLLLAIPTGILSVQSLKPKIMPEEVFYPEVILFPNIEFDVNIGEIDIVNYRNDIVDISKSEIDEIISIDLKLDEIGQHTGQISFKNSGMIYSNTFDYKVIDNESPLIHQSDIFTTHLHGTVDYQEYLSVTDNSLREGETLEIKVNDDNVNTGIPGNHYVTISTEDGSGNRAEYVAVVIVYEN